MNCKYLLICCTGLIYLLSSCIEPFESHGIREAEGLLVVEGMIMQTGTTIKLSRTVGIYNTVSSRKNVNGASIRMIDDNGQIIAVAEQQSIDEKAGGTIYAIVEPITFNPGTKYALDIQIGDKHYQSAFDSPVRTPEIDEITWNLKEDNSIDIFVSTHDPANEIIYYLWDFEEDWEIRSRMFAAYRYEPGGGEVIEQSLSGPNNTYYCWDSDKSKSILLGTAEKLTEATLQNKLIHNFPPYTSRSSYLYSILVKQYGINQQAYIYYKNLKENIEKSGSLFAPQQTELRGNLKCISHPDEDIIGYIAFTNKVESRLYIDMAYLWLDIEYDCGMFQVFVSSNLSEAFHTGWGIVSSFNDGSYQCAPRKCLDCTLRGGTKNKPDFWPNDHL